MDKATERATTRMIRETGREIEMFLNVPHGELQSIVDHMERPYGDEEFEPDDDFDWEE